MSTTYRVYYYPLGWHAGDEKVVGQHLDTTELADALIAKNLASRTGIDLDVVEKCLLAWQQYQIFPEVMSEKAWAAKLHRKAQGSGPKRRSKALSDVFEIRDQVQTLIEKKWGAEFYYTENTFGKPDCTEVVMDLPDGRGVRVEVEIMTLSSTDQEEPPHSPEQIAKAVEEYDAKILAKRAVGADEE